MVIRHLIVDAAPFLRLDTDMLGTESVHFGFDNGAPYLKANGRTIYSRDIQSVWSRRYALPRSLDAVQPEFRAFVKQELSYCLDAFIESVDGVHINPYDVDRRAGNRILQSVLASQCGLSTPKTIVTQSENDAKLFLEGTPDSVTKAISFGILSDGPEPLVAYTADINKNHSLNGLHVCPSLFQEKIRRKFDWRITTVGEKIFSARISASAFPATDWRALPSAQSAFEIAELPPEVCAKIILLCHRAGLRYGAHDLIEAEDGNFVFLETNPAGQWGWLETQLGLPVGRALADALQGK